MKTRRFPLMEENGDGTQGGAGGGGGAAAGSKWTQPDGAGGAGDGGAGGKSPEELAAEAAAAAAAAGGGDGGAGGGGEDFTPNAMWTELQAIEGFKMPEGLTKENELTLLKQALIQNKLAEEDGAGGAGSGDGGAGGGGQQQQQPVIDDPEVLAYLNYKKLNPEATLQNYMQQRTQYSDLLTLGDKDFMIEHYKREYGIFDEQKNPDGLKQEEIDDMISALENNKTLPLEARKLKKEYRKLADQTANVSQEDIQKAETQRRTDAVNKIKSDAQKLFAETSKITELNGVKIGQAELTEINSAFEKAVLPDEKGEIPIFKMLQSDRVLWNFFAINYLGDDKFKTALFNAGDSTKEDLMKRLGLKPINTSGRQASTGKKNVVTPGLWSSPDLSE